MAEWAKIADNHRRGKRNNGKKIPNLSHSNFLYFQKMNRNKLTAAFIVTVCISLFTLSGCSKSKSGDDGSTATVNFNVNLNNNLVDVGDVYIQSDVIVARIATGNNVSSFAAVHVKCTKDGTDVGYNALQNVFVCPSDGSRFSTTGTVVQGPATVNLRKYNISISGSTLTVTG